MDPEFITTSDWHLIGVGLRFLWAFVGSIILMAGSLIVAHMFIPSLLASGHIPTPWQQPAVLLRRLLYGAAFGALLLAIFTMVYAGIYLRDALASIFPRFFF